MGGPACLPTLASNLKGATALPGKAVEHEVAIKVEKCQVAVLRTMPTSPSVSKKGVGSERGLSSLFTKRSESRVARKGSSRLSSVIG